MQFITAAAAWAPAAACTHQNDLTLLTLRPLRCRAQDVVRRFREKHSDWEEFPEKVAFQLNDTHPTLLGASGGPSSLPACWSDWVWLASLRRGSTALSRGGANSHPTCAAC